MSSINYNITNDNVIQLMGDLLKSNDIKQFSKIMYYLDTQYRIGNELITDENWDMLENMYHSSTKNKWSVLDNRSKLINKVKLPIFMGSSDKISNEDEYDSFISKDPLFKTDVVLMVKLDGIAIEIIYDVKIDKLNCYTRGSGEYGSLITDIFKNMKEYKLVRNMIDDMKMNGNCKSFSIKGEAVIKKNVFEEYFKTVRKMKKARNTVAGIFSRKQTDINDLSKIDIIFYEYIDYESYLNNKPQLSFVDQMSIIIPYGLEIVKYINVDNLSYDIIKNTLNDMKLTSNVDMDGIIINKNKPYIRPKSGNPTVFFAYKGINETIDVTVKCVKWETSINKLLKPTIIYDKIIIDGTDNTTATVFNGKYILDNNIGPGTVLTIARVGDTIPNVVNIISTTYPQLPIEYKYTMIGTEYINLEADKDESYISKRIEKFCIELGMNGIREDTIKLIINNVKRIDFYKSTMTERFIGFLSLQYNDIITIAGFKNTRTNNILNEIKSVLSKSINMENLIVGSNMFPRLGHAQAKLLLKYHPDIVEHYSKEYYTEWYNALLNIQSFGNIMADNIIDNMEEFQCLYDELIVFTNIEIVDNKIECSDNCKNFCNGKIFVFSGIRDDKLIKIIESCNGKVSNSVSKKTTYLVSNMEKTSKYDKAVQLNIPIWTIDMLNEKLSS